MKREDIAGFCEQHGFDWAEQDDGIAFHWDNPNDPTDGECLHLTLDALDTIEPDKLRRAIIGGRDISHITRIVGYYSNTKNWNKSKIGELRDRRAGIYTVGAT